jgi:signal transduction histidine kinase
MDTVIRFDDTTHQLEKLRIKILFEQSGPAQFSGLVVAALYIYLVRHKATPHFLEIWTGSLFLLTVARLILIKNFSRYHIKLNRDFDPKKWENIFILFTAIAGAIWSVGVCDAFPVGDISFDSLMGYILAGITAGAAVAYSTSLKSTYSFFLPSVIPFVIRLALRGDETYWGMAIMLIAYTVVFLKLTHKFNKYAIKSLVLSFQKDQLIEKIRLMQSQVTQSAQMTALGRMAGGMAHEINNPLGIIMASSGSIEAFIEEWNTTKLKSDTPALFAKISTATGRIAKIIKELRFFAGRPGDELYESTPMTKIIETASNFCRERFKHERILFTVVAVPSDLVIECRPFHMIQVILNLLNNSFDAISERNEKWIRLEVVDFGEKVEVAITDSGDGISEEIRSKIMQPFFSTKEVGKGMGLGLSVSKGIVDSHQGELWLDIGSPNTRFVMSLPKIKNIVPQKVA